MNALWTKHNFALECGEHVVYLNRNNSSIKRWTNEPRGLDLARKACDTLKTDGDARATRSYFSQANSVTFPERYSV